ncbi:MAG: UbiA family prenyltransferase [Candidatus Nanohaloarchaea archaeon]
MDLLKFYRIRDWYHNMGMAVIGVLAAGVSRETLVPAAAGLLQVFLVQLHSFSMNNYYDAKYWEEDNYVRKMLEGGLERWKAYLIGHLPLLLALLFFPVSGTYTLLLLAYAALFYLYQGPPRLKTHWAVSILLNSVPLGLIVFLHPYLVTAGSLKPLGVFFSVLFTFYMAFYEIAHQLEHQGEEDFYSIVDRFGEVNSIRLAAFFLVIPSFAGVYFTVQSPGLNTVYLVPVFFLALRLVTLYRMEDYGRIRRSWHKFYAAPEGGFYLLILLLGLL